MGDFTDYLQDMFDNMENETLFDIFSTTNNSQDTENFQNKLRGHRYGVSGAALLVAAFSILVVISVFGNSLVVHVVVKNRKMHTVTYMFIANMALSDLLMTCLNVPLNIARELMSEWTIGAALCHLLNFSLMTSVYVSTFTLTAIALDRQRVLIYPLNPRITRGKGIVILILIWTLACILALPYGIYNTVQDLNLFVTTVKRCRTHFPFPSDKWEQYLTIGTMLIQYVIPLTIIAVTYGRIVHKLWLRTQLGVVTEKQRVIQIQEKRKSIKLLVSVVVVFAVCWMPLNLYHLLTDLHPNAKRFTYDSTVFFVCHWVAISSTCINPFLYCWMNPIFKREFKNILKCWCCSQSSTSRSYDLEFDDLISPSKDRRRVRYRMQFTSGRACSQDCSNLCSVSSSDSKRGGESNIMYSNKNTPTPSLSGSVKQFRS